MHNTLRTALLGGVQDGHGRLLAVNDGTPVSGVDAGGGDRGGGRGLVARSVLGRHGRQM